MAKRPGNFSVGGMINQRRRLEEQTSSTEASGHQTDGFRNPFLKKPVAPEQALQIFLTQVRNSARKYLPSSTPRPYTKPFCEVEARLGILQINQRRVTSSGLKRHPATNAIIHAFDCTSLPQQPSMASGVSRSHYAKWTDGGLSELGPITSALGVVVKNGTSHKEAIGVARRDLVEREYVETVFAGYPQERRISFPGFVSATNPAPQKAGQMEYKEKLNQMNFTIPAAKYDFRVDLASEKVVDPAVTSVPPGWQVHRVKRRRSYSRKDGNIAWQIDVTEVTSTPKNFPDEKTVSYEIEFELKGNKLLRLINEDSPERVQAMTKDYSKQLWWMLSQVNHLEETVDVEEYLREHPSAQAVRLALATCGALKRFMDKPPAIQPGKAALFDGPIAKPHETPSPALSNMDFPGCMPVNFSRHNIKEVQQAPANGYFLSEKTDGVRHFMVFTGDTVVLVDRAMKAKQIKSANQDQDPMAHLLPLIKPGTVFDGEVVMHRGNPGKHPARPIFIVFDVLAVGPTEAIMHLPFEQRLYHLHKATFRTETANRNMFADELVANEKIPLPLVRKNFVTRTKLADLLGKVTEEKGARSYRSLPVHNHLTDGIIFQPNQPYKCGTDMGLLKWKYLDTVTIDVEILPMGFGGNNRNHNDDALCVGVMGPEGTTVNMSRHIHLPKSELYRLEADKFESGARIAEVGLDPESEEWYYLTMRPDKTKPNHIDTVMGTLVELCESLTTEELQYRMNIPPGNRDTYRKNLKGMLTQMLDFQERSLQKK